jgi:hypothetical protein
MKTLWDQRCELLQGKTSNVSRIAKVHGLKDAECLHDVRVDAR